MHRKLSFLILSLCLAGTAGWAQKELLNAGPMVGYAEMREVMLWVQTVEEAEVSFQYWNQVSPDQILTTATKKTLSDEAFVAKFRLSPLDPGQHYTYRLQINGNAVDLPYRTDFQTLPIWKWRGDAPDFSFAAGSCAYINEPDYDRPGTPYGDHYEVFPSIYETDPDFMVWMGDNIYFREPDWNSRTGVLHRYTHDRAIPELQAMLGSMHHYATWDDHDYGPNNSDRSFWNKDITLEAFQLFWANPSYGTEDMPGAITYFNWNDADFFLMDNRWYRSPNDLQSPGKTQFGDLQRQWLKDNLASSTATFKFVVTGGQFLNDVIEHETFSNYGFSDERQEIIDFIHQHDIRGVIFLTGDRHHSELSRMEVEGEPVIYDLTLSPLTAGPNRRAAEEENSFRVPGKIYTDRNFGLLNVSGDRVNRKIDISVRDSSGKEVWSYTIEAREWYR